MNQLSPTIRKAAVLIDALDERSADALLDQMAPETARRVRSAVMELGAVTESERQAVLAEFLRGPSPAASPASEPGVELSASLSERLNETPPTNSVPAPADSWDFLRAVSPRELARVLARESAQTVAVVVAQLDAELAAQVLEQLPSDQATDALERLACLEEPAADVLTEIARHLRLELSHCLNAAGQPAALSNLQAVLGAMDFAARDRVLAVLGQRNRTLARQLGYVPSQPSGQSAAAAGNYAVSSFRFRLERQEHTPAPRIDFDDFAALSDDTLRRILAAARPQVALLALTGADEALVGRIVEQLPPREAAALSQRLNYPGAVRLADIEAARDELVSLARRLAEDGTITLPPARRFAAAA
jgi:flagellar motor switch protein FliG